MSWTAPRTWTTNEVVTSAIMNAHVRDNLKAMAPVHYSEGTADVSVTATASGSPTSILAGAAVTYEARPILIEFWAYRALDGGGGGDSHIGLYDSTTLVTDLALIPNSTSIPVYCAHRLTPTAASHTYAIKGWSPTGAALTVYAGSGTGGAVAPMFLRIRYDEF